MNNQQYNPAGLDRLYSAIRLQAENEFLQALHRDFPDMGLQEEMWAIHFYRRLRDKAEQQIIQQSRGKQE